MKQVLVVLLFEERCLVIVDHLAAHFVDELELSGVDQLALRRLLNLLDRFHWLVFVEDLLHEGILCLILILLIHGDYPHFALHQVLVFLWLLFLHFLLEVTRIAIVDQVSHFVFLDLRPVLQIFQRVQIFMRECLIVENLVKVCDALSHILNDVFCFVLLQLHYDISCLCVIVPLHNFAELLEVLLLEQSRLLG